MHRKRKICVVVTARPSYSRIKTALKAIDDHPDLKLQLVVAGSALLDRYGTAVNYILKDGFKIAEKVYNVLEGENPTSMAKTTGLAVMELSTLFYNLKCDAVITIADRFETIATSIAASFQNIPLVHIQGGEVTGSIDEKVRHANTKLADLHLVASEDARRRVIKMGENPDGVINTGCPSIDLAAEVLKDPALSFDPYKKYGGVGSAPDLSTGYIVVMQHPVTSEYKLSRQHIEETLVAVNNLNFPALWFWPNVDAGSDGTSTGIRSFREYNKLDKVHFFKNMEPVDFLKLLFNSKCLIGNSSVGIRECAFLGVPVVNIGSRQTGRVRGNNVIDVDYSSNEILSAVEKRIKNGECSKSTAYGHGNSGEIIADILAKAELKSVKRIMY
ncbi:UDP-N-acetylglucosamine 2-epimerase [Marinilabiliaceae bacterium ANBcel2]|nr:UDP-N-acetylglucosamine 2-epimerase [Marinilabiliaceae bacterium ANBcel2]